MKVVCRHIAANCNPKPNVLSFLDKETIVFAFSSHTAIYSLSQNQILLTIHDQQTQHKRVNCLAVFPSAQTIFCGYDTGYLISYSYKQDLWRKVSAAKQSSGLLSIQTLLINDCLHIFTNNNNAEITHYVVENQEFKVEEEIKFPLNRIIETVCCYQRGGTLMLFMGGADQKIHYYQKPLKEENSKFNYRFSLSGHENAITKLVITEEQPEGDLLLASSSKDGYIRLWRITSEQEVLKFHKNVYSLLLDHHVFLESVLTSHQCSVTSLAWVRFDGVLQLVSSSLDCTICLWTYQEASWTVTTRLGQFLGNKNAYFDIVADPTFEHLGALNYTGALIMWRWSQGKWVLRESFNGHSSEVKSIEWNHTGDFLVTVSKDQTTRVIAKNLNDNKFHQISRAQIHGYDINAVTVVKVKQNTLDLIVCGADQKVIRVLEPPACFANYLNSFTRANLHLFFPTEAQEAQYRITKPEDPVLLYETYAEGGTQVLGLMTKMQRVEREKITNYFDEDEGGPAPEEAEVTEEEEHLSSKIDFLAPPHEDYLVKHTLWPEMAKLYGHPHEIYTLCRSNSYKVLASSCKALSKESASIILWSVGDWKILKVIPFHSYTVYALQFSPSDKYLASGSKDRKLAVYSSDFNLLFSYEAHLRAITCISFHLGENMIITGSRDKTIKLHSVAEQKPINQLNLKHPISAIAFCKLPLYQDYFAVGCVNGDVFLGTIEGGSLKIIQTIKEQFSHNNEINSLKWANKYLASCSDDYSVRIFELEFGSK